MIDKLRKEDYNILVVSALNGTFPLALRKKFPKARIICAEVYSYFTGHLRKLGFEVLMYDEINDDMKFDVVVGNPPFNDTDTHHDNGHRKQGKNLSKFFFNLSLKIAIDQIILVASYSQRTYSKKTADEFKDNGLYLIEDHRNHFPSVMANIATFYFDKTKKYGSVRDEMSKTTSLTVPLNNLASICYPRATHNGLARSTYEHELSEIGKTMVVLTTSVQKYTDDESLINRMGDRTRGFWRVVFNKVSDKKGTGKLFIASPSAILTQNVGCFTVDSQSKAMALKKYLELESVSKKIGELKISNSNSKTVFQYIENPLQSNKTLGQDDD